MTLPAWMDDGTGGRRERNRRSARQEKKHAKREGGQVQAGSGSSWRAPQDVRTDHYLDQLKFTDRPSYRVTVEEWSRIRADAHRAGREPRLIIEFPGVTLVIVEQDS